MAMENNRQSQTAGDKAAKTNEDVVVQDKSRRKALLFAVTGAALVLLAAIIMGVTVFGDSGRKLQEQLDLGAKYLEEMDYEQALVAFNTALEIEPKNVDAYLGIVEVYIRTNEFETALEYAREGYGVTGDERLKEKIDMIESGDIFASNGWRMKSTFYDGSGNLLRWHEYAHNRQGQEASVAVYNAQGVQEQYLECAYDDEGRETITWGQTSNGELIKYAVEYNANGYRETWYEGTGDRITGYAEVELDFDGRDLRKTFYGEDGSVNYTLIFEYDEEGRLSRQAYYSADSELLNYTVYVHDEEGRSWQMQFYDGDSVLAGYMEDVHDDEGNLTGQRWYDADGVLQYEQVIQ